MSILRWFMLFGMLIPIACEESGDVTRSANNSDSETDTASSEDGSTTGTSGENEPIRFVDGDMEECADFPWTVNVRPINLLVLLDRSYSMKRYTVAGTEISYAEVMREAILEVVEQHAPSGIIRFALNAFPSPKMCSAAYGDLPPADQLTAITCQAASQFIADTNPYTDPLIPFYVETPETTMAEFRSVLETVGQCGGTPITKSLQWARTWLDSLALSDDTYVLLATDGAPSCSFSATLPCEPSAPGMTPLASEQCLDDMDATHAAFDLAAAGYRTFVIGVGEEVTAFMDVMDAIAYWGGRHRVGTEASIYDFSGTPPVGDNWFYNAQNADELTLALENVTNNTLSCVYEVDWANLPASDDDSGRTVYRACHQVRVFGNPSGEAETSALTYMANCQGEDPLADDPRLRYGWTWDELSGVPWTEVQSIGSDTSQCTRVRLCPNACAQLRFHRGERHFENISASFGCQPVILID